MQKINLKEKFSLFHDCYHPRVIGELNGQLVKIVKIRGPFVWHHHDKEDEFFMVIRGRFTMEFRDRAVELEEGDCIIVPRGVEHRPNAAEEAEILLFEPAATLNTGNLKNEFTHESLEKL